MIKLRFLLLGILLLRVTASSIAQSVENVNASFEGEKMVITYDLRFTDAEQKFKVAIYSSHDNYGSPLSATGDLGESVISGKAKKVVWNVKSALPSGFDADITIKVKAVKVPPPVAPLAFKPFDVSVYKRGRVVELYWVGGSLNDRLNVELYRNNVSQVRIADKIENKQSYTWHMAKSQKPGKDYQVRISNSGKPTEFAVTQNFRIKRRVPFIVKVLPFVAIGGVLAFLGRGPGPGPDPTNEDLPGPVKPN